MNLTRFAEVLERLVNGDTTVRSLWRLRRYKRYLASPEYAQKLEWRRQAAERREARRETVTHDRIMKQFLKRSAKDSFHGPS